MRSSHRVGGDEIGDVDETKFCKIAKVKGDRYEELENEMERIGCKKGDSFLFTRPHGEEVARVCEMSTVTYFVYSTCEYIGYVRNDR